MGRVGVVVGVGTTRRRRRRRSEETVSSIGARRRGRFVAFTIG
jgi:hypothetical protein